MDKVFQVSEFNELINQHLSLLPELTVIGEISELKAYQDKYLYLTLKDPATSATVSVFGITFTLSNWRSLEIGMQVYVQGVGRLHQKSGKFSLSASRITPAGEGALKLAYEKLKLQLQHEGLFDPQRKRSLPRFPQRLGLITAPNSEAYNDFIKVLAQRMGGLHIYFYPVSVQGRSAIASILGAFKYFQTHPELQLDGLVLCRGGGSFEDLIAFNDEQVVRALFSSPLPVVVGVGHERDISLCDLVADVRASTPSNAAELIVLHRRELLDQVSFFRSRLIGQLDSQLHTLSTHSKFAVRSLISSASSHLLTQHHRLNRAIISLERHVALPINHVSQLLHRFATTPVLISGQLRATSSQLTKTTSSLLTSSSTWIHLRQSQLDQLIRLFMTFDSTTVLKRGYSLTRTASGQLIRSVSQVAVGEPLLSQVSDGTITSEVTQHHG